MARIKWSDLIIGASSSLIAYRFLKSAFSDAEESLTRIEATRAGSKCPGNSDIPCKLYPAGSIENRVKMIAGLIRKGSLDPQVRRLAVRSVSKKCGGDFCLAAKDAAAELKTILDDFGDPSSELAKNMRKLDGGLAGVKHQMRYTSDGLISDVFQSAHRSLFDFHGGDCDDFACALGSVYMALGFPVKLRTYTLKGASEPGHIAIRVNPDKKGRTYVTVDGSVSTVRLKNGKKVPTFVGWDAAEHSNLIDSWVDHKV